MMKSLALLAALLLMAQPASAQTYQRIVSVGGAVTEIVNELRLGDRLVAVDSTSLHPPAMRTLPQVGYMRALSAEGVVALHPDLVLLSDNAGPPAVVEQMRGLGIPLKLVPDRPTVEGVADKIRAVGAALGKEREAETMAREIVDRVAAIGRLVEKIPNRPRVLFLMGLGAGSPIAAGGNTAADAIIRLAGGVNAIDGYDGYKPASGEAILDVAPDVLLLPAEAVDSAGGRDAVLALPQFSGTPAARDGRLVAMDTLYLLGFGPRLPDAVADLARALHPDLAKELPPAAAGGRL
jgi:iron complex transport system substrate-binding protein